MNLDRLNSNWALETSAICYWGLVLILTLGIRVILSALSAMKEAHEARTSYFRIVRKTFRGFQRPDNPEAKSIHVNYWYNSILGGMELSVYPVLMAIGAWEVIGVWVGFKTVAQWHVWQVDRAVFNLFLIGNAINVGTAWWFLLPLVRFSP
jgi:hypothetical protein